MPHPTLRKEQAVASPLKVSPAPPITYKEYTEMSPECSSLGHYFHRPTLAARPNPLMTSRHFSIIIRNEGPFDSTGQQPGLPIAKTERFVVRLSTSFTPGERKVDIWRNGETFQVFGVVAVYTDECGWFVGDKKLRLSSNGTYSGRAESQRLLESVGLSPSK